ncbi:MAG: M64 family metallopeptidase [Acidobacteriota bacterium]
MLSFDNKRWREIVVAAPYEFVEIVTNTRTYGGGGIFNLYATVAADNAFTPYVFVHEFGHHFAGLADEYYTSDVAYTAGSERPEPWEPNVTANATTPKWNDLIAADTPRPTRRGTSSRSRRTSARFKPDVAPFAPPANRRARWKRCFARNSLERSNCSAPAHTRRWLEASKAPTTSRPATIALKPIASCSRATEGGFCAACRRAIQRVIDLYAP